MELLYRVSGVVSSDLPLDDMLKALVSLALEVTQGDACLVYLAEPDGGEMVLRASQTSPGAEMGDTYEALLTAPLVSGGEVIGTIHVHHKEPHAHTRDEIACLTFVGEQMGNAIARTRAAEQAARAQQATLELKRELDARKVVERAKGILQRKHSLTEEQAYFRLRNLSRRLRRPLRELAEAIIVADTVDRGADPGG